MMTTQNGAEDTVHIQYNDDPEHHLIIKEIKDAEVVIEKRLEEERLALKTENRKLAHQCGGRAATLGLEPGFDFGS